MDGQGFLRVIRDAFIPFLSELGFSMNAPSISGRYYRVSFDSPKALISISFEPGDEALFVMIFSRENGQLSDADDRVHTPRLAELNILYMPLVTDDERKFNETLFQHIQATDKEERNLLKIAKELRLVLPKHMNAASKK